MIFLIGYTENSTKVLILSRKKAK